MERMEGSRGLIGWFDCDSFHPSLIYLGYFLALLSLGGWIPIYLGALTIVSIHWEIIRGIWKSINILLVNYNVCLFAPSLFLVHFVSQMGSVDGTYWRNCSNLLFEWPHKKTIIALLERRSRVWWSINVHRFNIVIL